MPTAFEVGKKLVELCSQDKFNEASEQLHSPNIVSIEPGGGSPTMPARMEGIAAIRGKAEWWEKNHTVHSVKVEGPWPHGDRFIARFILDVTPTSGKMAGQKFHMDETALYTVKDGKIIQEEFFYSMGG